MALLISFIGLDGSGKSTLSKWLLKILKEEFNLECRYSWVKFGTTFLGLNRIFAKKYNKKLYKKRDNPYKFLGNKLLRNLYLIYLLFEHWLQLIFSVRIPLMFGKTVVCDRYYYDSIVDLVVNFDLDYSKAKKLIKLLIGAPKPDLTIYLDVDEYTAYNRKSDIYNINYLKMKRE
ncbi:MAG: hypothetical protein H5T85_03415, partial [Actinobacteria bacterium]|nr:hypothetical protein [Actinomycetota bacterium]